MRISSVHVKQSVVAALFLLIGIFCSNDSLDKANALLESGDFLSARRIYSRAIEHESSSYAAHYGMGMTFCAEALYKTKLGLVTANDWYQSIYQMTLAYNLSDNNNTEIRKTLAVLHYNLGAFYKKAGEKETALERLEQAVSYDSTLLKAYNLLGSLYYEKGDLRNAIRCYNRVLDIQPDYAMAHFNLGAAFYALDDDSAAAEHFGKAAKLEPDNSYFSEWYTKAREGIGKP
jgi:tetratricopeptide (TPR) repeat protein